MKTLTLFRHTEEPHKGWYTLTRERDSDEEVQIEYDENALCVLCGLPVVEASMSGTTICPWCDSGVCRFDGSHRVDMEGFDPVTGRMYAPRVHYERHHSDEYERGRAGR